MRFDRRSKLIIIKVYFVNSWWKPVVKRILFSTEIIKSILVIINPKISAASEPEKFKMADSSTGEINRRFKCERLFRLENRDQSSKFHNPSGNRDLINFSNEFCVRTQILAWGMGRGGLGRKRRDRKMGGRKEENFYVKSSPYKFLELK